MNVDAQVEFVQAVFKDIATSNSKDAAVRVLDECMQLLIATGYNADIVQDIRQQTICYIDYVIKESVFKTRET